MPTDIPALIERLRRHCYCGSLKWAYEDRESDVCDIHCAAAALAEQGKALAAARVAEGEAMLVVEQQDREIARLERLCDLQQGQLTAEQDARDTACRQLAEAREVPMQPVALDDKGVARFKQNAIVRFLLDAGPFDLNRLAVMPFSDEDRMQFAQLIEYSVGGYEELSYVSDESAARARSVLKEE